MAELVPNIASHLRLSLPHAFDICVFAMILLGVLVGYYGFWCLFPDVQVRWAGVLIFLCLGFVEAKVADVYVFQISPLLAGIPWVLHFALKRNELALLLSAVLLAFCCSWCSLVRIGTTAICLVFLATLFVIRCGVRGSLVPLLLVLFACMPCMLMEHHLTAKRDALLKGFGERATAVNSHPIWHAIYTGLGFVPNKEVRGFNDVAARTK